MAQAKQLRKALQSLRPNNLVDHLNLSEIWQLFAWNEMVCVYYFRYFVTLWVQMMRPPLELVSPVSRNTL